MSLLKNVLKFSNKFLHHKRGNVPELVPLECTVCDTKASGQRIPCNKSDLTRRSIFGEVLVTINLTKFRSTREHGGCQVPNSTSVRPYLTILSSTGTWTSEIRCPSASVRPNVPVLVPEYLDLGTYFKVFESRYGTRALYLAS